MGKILEFLTVNLAVKELEPALDKFRAMGLAPLKASHMPEPPAEITDVSVPFGRGGAVSVIAATAPSSPVAKFIDKRGEGVYSVAVRVDSLEEVMEEWKSAGLQWVLPEPYAFPPGNPAVQYVPDRLLVNWVRPSSLNGMMLEVFEFQGELREHPADPGMT